MATMMPPPTDNQVRIACPRCGDLPTQRIDNQISGTTVAACVCADGHLFTVEWTVRS